MKKLFINYYVFFATIGCLILTSCGDKKADAVDTTTQEHMEAEIKTIENMQVAYKGEKTATAKYEAFARKAEEEGYHNIALLYNAVSAAENIHANNHKAVIEDAGATVPTITPEYKVKTTKENLYDDIHEEVHEAKTMYPEFLKTAEIAKNKIAVSSLMYAMKTELKHIAFFEDALIAVNSNTTHKLPTEYFVCPVCGNTYSTAPKRCDFSLTEKESFIQFK